MLSSVMKPIAIQNRSVGWVARTLAGGGIDEACTPSAQTEMGQ
jgi:hypothetical protein